MLEKQLQKKVKTQHVSQGFLIDFTYCLQKNKEQDQRAQKEEVQSKVTVNKNRKKIKKKVFCEEYLIRTRTTDTQWRHKSKKSENLGQCGRQNMLRPYLKIWEWEWILGRAVKTISSPGVRSQWAKG